MCKNSNFTNIWYRKIYIEYTVRKLGASKRLLFEGEFFDFSWFIFVLWTTWMLGQPPLAVLPPGKISYTCRIAPHIIINYRLLTYGAWLWWQLGMQCDSRSTPLVFNTLRRADSNLRYIVNSAWSPLLCYVISMSWQ